jgi:hypothetical protein
MVPRLLRVCFILSLAFFCGFEIHLSTGIVGVTKKSRATAFFHGCICHGDSASPNVQVWISGPDSLSTGQQGLFRIFVAKNANIAAGFNVASFRGALGVADSLGTQLLRPDSPDSLELTHCFPKLSQGRDTISWLFYYKAPSLAPFVDTLYSCGNSVDTSHDPTGDFWNFGASFRVKITPPVGVNEGARVAHAFFLLQNYPNPFNPSTTIVFRLPHGDRYDVSLRVFNAGGQEVATLLDVEEEGGDHEAVFDVRAVVAGKDNRGLASGVYFYRLDARSVEGNTEFRSVCKMLLLK